MPSESKLSVTSSQCGPHGLVVKGSHMSSCSSSAVVNGSHVPDHGSVRFQWLKDPTCPTTVRVQ